jgi:hypothetical protein
VNIEELFNMFDHKTRTAIKINTNNFGDGLAGAASGLNNTIHELRPLVTERDPGPEQPRRAADRLRELFIALDRAAGAGRARRRGAGRLLRDLDTFFTAFASVTKSLEEATEGGPASLQQATYSLPARGAADRKGDRVHAPVCARARSARDRRAALGHAFKEGAINLAAAHRLNTPPRRNPRKRSPKFGQNPVVKLAFEDFTQTLEVGTPLLAGIAPEQAKCNYLTLAFRNVASLESENIGVGNVARAGFVLAPDGPNNEGFPSSAPPTAARPKKAGWRGSSTTTTCT